LCGKESTATLFSLLQIHCCVGDAAKTGGAEKLLGWPSAGWTDANIVLRNISTLAPGEAGPGTGTGTGTGTRT